MFLIPQINFDSITLASVDFRERFERRTNKDFDISKPDNRSDLISRYRFNFESTGKTGPKLKVTYQYYHDLAWTPSSNFSSDHSDIFVGQIEGTEGPVNYTLGRQVINIGHMLEYSNWTTGRTFDGLRLKAKNFDVFAAKLGEAVPHPRYGKVGGLLHTGPGLYEGLLVKHDENGTGRRDINTLYRLYEGKHPHGKWSYEGGYQFGKNAGINHSAFGLQVRGDYDVNAKTKALGRLVYASGSNPGTSHTWDSYYPWTHNQYGLSDLMSWSNLIDAAVGAEWKLGQPSARLVYHKYWLANSKDGWYASNGTLNKWSGGNLIDTTGNSGNNIGSALDLEVYGKAWGGNLSAGVGSFFPGTFISNIAGVSDKQLYMFFMFERKF